MPQRPENYTHALTIQLGFIPAGFFPIGSVENLTALTQDFFKTGASQKGAKLYELTRTPEFTKPEVTEEALLDRAQQILKGDMDVQVSTKTVQNKFAPTLSEIQRLAAEAQALLKGNEKGELDILKLAGVFVGAQTTLQRGVETVKQLGNEISEKFWDIKTDTYIRNSHGVFVSRQWLENEANAKFLSHLKFKRPNAPENVPV